MNIQKAEFTFSHENLAKAEKILGKYPVEKKFSAIMPLLTLAQKQNGGFLNKECIDYLASYLNVPPMAFYEVANFYSMYTFQPVGKYHFQFCKSVVCMIQSSEDLYNYCKKITNTEHNSVSADGLFSVTYVECLGACVNAVAIKINDEFYENINQKTLLKLVESLKKGEPIKQVNVVQKSAIFNKG